VQHLTFLSQHEKDVFKTAYELDQNWIIELAADRTPHISQSQSLNIFMPGDVSKQYLHDIHFKAWKKGIKSAYYARSTSIQRADKVSHTVLQDQGMMDLEKSNNQVPGLPVTRPERIENNYDECLSCQ
jgi:ribonucleoside-diphosphate reductase alpha chain